MQVFAMAQAVLDNIGASQSLLATTQGRPKFAHISRAERVRVQSLMLSARGASVKAKQAVEDSELLNHYLSTAAKHAAGQ